MKKTLSEDKQNWWSDGVRFECQGSGRCCVSHGEYGHVWMTIEDRRRMASVLKMDVRSFTRKYCERSSDGFFRLKDPPSTAADRESCIFLKDKRCSVYEGRPTQCRTWPFWPEVMNAKTWKKEVAAFCPGVGKGHTISAAQIQMQLKEQAQSERELLQDLKYVSFRFSK